ncbi:hypothetical protein [Mycobacterium shigaense]|uniref:Uncharacterized protein n=1 Tax=Mycobacterium shigaense TaxID=722731 RepID=A0A1Z4EMF7_9MYCO|nr:hypothetical protein [Mycobacterium shigaense]MEA1120768.1 hypothetical protein [Mycobacterium shigaense]BAX94138.1 hypothetical protein MSG_04015 [Mycobacterium shigaense]
MTGTRLAARIQVPQVGHLLHGVQSVRTLLVISAAGMWPAQPGTCSTAGVQNPCSARSRQ